VADDDENRIRDAAEDAADAADEAAEANEFLGNPPSRRRRGSGRRATADDLGLGPERPDPRRRERAPDPRRARQDDRAREEDFFGPTPSGGRHDAGRATAEDFGLRANQAASTARGVGEMIESAASELDIAEYRFATDDQDGGWQVEAFELEERMNETYTCDVQLTSEDLTATGNELLGKSCLLRVQRGSQVRNVRGIVTRVEQRSGGRGTRAIRARIVPAAYALGKTRNSRIFQEMNAIDILQQVLGQGLQAYGRELRVSAEAANYVTREYCVQYRESDLAFAQRIMAEEGIAFHFVHDESDAGEILVLTDGNDQFRAALDGDQALEVLSRSDEHSNQQSIRNFNVRSQLTPTGTVVRDYDWTRPSLEVNEGEAGADAQGRTREVYEHESPVRFSEYSEPSFAESNAARQAELRQQAEVVRRQVARGTSDCNALEPGTTFSIQGHVNAELDQQYVVVACTHRGRVRAEGNEALYENEFECIPSTVRFVPPRPREGDRPAMPGYCTATVVGPDGEEIHTDVHGRIRIRFHWDRGNTPPEQSSCWIRVCQSWAGPGYGCMFVPRIGMEVVIQFEGGNVDRPLCTGSVYNGENTPPLQLPDERTQCVIRTQSTPGGNGYNEIRIEDQAGEECISVHAQRDHTLIIEHDETRTIHNNYTLGVDVNCSISIGGTLTWSVTGEQTCTNRGARQDVFESGRSTQVNQYDNLTVYGPHDVDVHGVYSNWSTVQIVDNVGEITVLDLTIPQASLKSPMIVMKAESILLLEVGASKILLTPSKILIQSPEIAVESLTGANVQLAGGKALVDAPIETKINSIASSYTVNPNGAKGVGRSKHEIEGGEVAITNSGGANVKLIDDEVKLND
jgi:type VI secretion system secreted protein VgrG